MHRVSTSSMSRWKNLAASLENRRSRAEELDAELALDGPAPRGREGCH